MRVFRPIVEAMTNLAAIDVADLAHRSGIGAKPVGDDAPRPAIFLHDALQKLQRRGLVPLRRDHRFQNLALVIDSPPEIAPKARSSMCWSRNKHAALKLMRKLLKKHAFAPGRLVTDDLRSYGAAVRELGIERRHERGPWKNIVGLRIRISRRGGGGERCSASRARGQPRNFFPHTPLSTTPSTSNAISSQPTRTARFALSLTTWQTAVAAA